MKIEMKKKCWNDITISDFKRILEINEQELDSDLEKSISVLSVLCECNEDDLYNMNINNLQTLIAEMEWMNKPFTFNRNWNSKHITINGVKYDVVADINKFSVAQYADFQIYWSKRDDVNYMGKLLTVFIVPSGKNYNDGYDIVELSNILETYVSLPDFNAICFFFLMDCLYSVKASLYYSNWEVTKMIHREKDKTKKKELKELRKKVAKEIKNYPV